MARWLTRIAVCLLLIGQISAVSEPDRAFRDARTAACQSQQKLSHRLDAIEERVQDTVWKLESEMSVLLDTIQDPDWSFHPSTDSAAVDMLDESPQS